MAMLDVLSQAMIAEMAEKLPQPLCTLQLAGSAN